MKIAGKLNAKERILKTARELFYSRGINNTGIDLIIAQSGVAKASMYNNFRSKEELVAEYLGSLRAEFDTALAAMSEERGSSVEIPFALLKVTLENGQFFGCPFANAMVELPDSALVKEQVMGYRQAVHSYFMAVTNNDENKSSKLMLVYDGSFMSCKLNPDEKTVSGAIQLARSISTSK